jgi:hypothetical protein
VGEKDGSESELLVRDALSRRMAWMQLVLRNSMSLGKFPRTLHISSMMSNVASELHAVNSRVHCEFGVDGVMGGALYLEPNDGESGGVRGGSGTVRSSVKYGSPTRDLRVRLLGSTI